MKRLLLIVAVLVAAAAAGGAALLLTADQEAVFTEADAERAVREALERCRHALRDADTVECRDVGAGFACRADGRFVAGFEVPDPDHPEFSVVC